MRKCLIPIMKSTPSEQYFVQSAKRNACGHMSDPITLQGKNTLREVESFQDFLFNLAVEILENDND